MGKPLILVLKVKEFNGATVWKELKQISASEIDESLERMGELLKKKFG